MRSLLLTAFFLQFFFTGNCQNTDSLARSIDSSAKQIQHTYKALEDSLGQLTIHHSISKNEKELDQFLADYKEQKEKEKRQVYIRIGLGLAFVTALSYGWARKRKLQKPRKN